MATKADKAYFVPIGCSCINQFQLDFRFGKINYDSQLFDWNIVTPDSTIKIIDSKNKPFVNSIMDLSLHGNKILRSEVLPGFYWWHMNHFINIDFNFNYIKDFEPHFEEFKKKHDYQISKFFNMADDNVVFIWSNLQPNLKLACSKFLEQFILTNSRYRALKEVINDAFSSSKIIFLVRPELVERSLIGQNDVIKIDVPFSSDYKGDMNLYSVVFDRFVP